MFLELKDVNNEFRKRYFETLKYRLAFGSLELEEMNDNLAEVSQTLKIYNQLVAINYIFEQPEYEELKHFQFTKIVCDVVERVTGGEIIGFRKTKAIVKGSKVERTSPEMILNNLYYLIDDYNYQMRSKRMSYFEIEAAFHIRFLHIHPFEDGNGRVARILLTHHLCNSDLAPCIITKNSKSEYCSLIENSDIKGLALFFEKLSNKEFDNMICMYKDLDEKGQIISNKMTKEQEEEYYKLK